MAEKRSAKKQVSQLIEVVIADDVKTVNAMLAAGADPTAADNRGRTPLQYAERREPSKAQEAIVGMLGGTAGADDGRGVGAGTYAVAGGNWWRTIARVRAHFRELWQGWALVVGGTTAFALFLVFITGFSRDPESWLLVGLFTGLSVVFLATVLTVGCAFTRFVRPLLPSKPTMAISIPDETDEDEPDRTPLMAALEEGAGLERLRSLIAQGANVNERNEYLGQTY